MVLLKEAWTWATPSVTTRLVFFFDLEAGLSMGCPVENVFGEARPT
jgi:hypothetical protein